MDIIEFWIVLSDPSGLIEVGHAHGNVIIVLIEEFSGICVGRGTQIFPVRSPFFQRYIV